MTYYNAYIGSWHDADGIKQIGEGYSRKEIFAKAQEVANKSSKIVTIISKRGSAAGLHQNLFLIHPIKIDSGEAL